MRCRVRNVNKLGKQTKLKKDEERTRKNIIKREKAVLYANEMLKLDSSVFMAFVAQTIPLFCVMFRENEQCRVRIT
jgi:hypothetical protein